MANQQEIYQRFQSSPEPVLFSPALASLGERHADIIERIKVASAAPDRPYMGEIDHPDFGRLEWMIYVLPEGDPWEINLAMSVRLFDELWAPDLR